MTWKQGMDLKGVSSLVVTLQVQQKTQSSSTSAQHEKRQLPPSYLFTSVLTKKTVNRCDNRPGKTTIK